MQILGLFLFCTASRARVLLKAERGVIACYLHPEEINVFEPQGERDTTCSFACVECLWDVLTRIAVRGEPLQ